MGVEGIPRRYCACTGIKYWVGKPTKAGVIRVPRAVGRSVIVLKTVRATRDGFRMTRKRFVVKPGIRNGPVEILSGQCLPAILAVVSDPALAIIVSLCSDNIRLVLGLCRGNER